MRDLVKVLLVTTALLFVLSGCSEDDKKNAAPAQMPPMQVTVHSVEKKDVDIFYEYPAKVKSIQQVEVVSKVSGTLMKKLFKEGDTVKAGQVLYKIDSEKYRANFNQAKANYDVQVALLSSATTNYERMKKLHALNAISQQNYDDALSSYDSASAQLLSAKSTMELAKIDLDYTDVKAPFTGIVGISKIDVGTYVNAVSDQLAQLTQVNPLHVEFSLPDREFMAYRDALKNLSVELYLPNGVKHNQDGKINFIDNNINTLTSTVQARAFFENIDNAIVPGQFVRVKIVGLKLIDTVALPQNVVMQDTSGAYVYVIKDGTAQRVAVTISQSTNGEFIISSGLNGGEEIISNNLTKLRPNSPVVKQ